tara:strand:- start:223 stop:453 length:231 start_codon:yes stop_codon:yes gene_type:complete
MKDLQYFKILLERQKELDYSTLDKISVRGKDGKVVVHQAKSKKTVKDVEDDEDLEEEKDKPKKKLSQYKNKKEEET